ncbi:MAG: hypothetical protein ACRECU_12255, partial [Methylocella sp.]
MKFSASIKIGVAAAICLAGMSLCVPRRERALAAQPDSTGGAMVKLVRAVRECFSDTIYVTGILVPRREAVVTLGQGSIVTEVLATDGDQVNAGQALARAMRPSSAGPASGTRASINPTSTTITLKAPAAGLVTHVAASVG